MKPALSACLVTAAIVCAHLPVRLSAGETARLRHLVSVYFDDKGVGFNLPEGVACDGTGQFVVGDTGNDRLVRFSYQEKTLAGGAEIKIPELASPARVRFSATGEIFALDSRARRIVRLGPKGEFRAALALRDVPAPAPIPKAFTLDAAGTIYVLDVFGSRVLVLNAEAQFQKALPLPGDARFVSDVAVDPSGNIILLDSIKRALFAAGQEATSFAPVGGNLMEYLPTLPAYMTVTKGLIFVVEGSGSRIVGFGRDGAFVSRQLAMGWGEGSLNHPSQMCVNEKDEVFIADRDNSRVQVFQLVR
jgi:hypothetical protein